MKNSIISIILVFSLIFISCGGSEGNVCESCGIYGVVTDYDTGESVANANVQLRPGGETTLTGSDGMFEFRSLPSGDYLITVSKAGYSDLIDDYVITVRDRMVRRDVQIANCKEGYWDGSKCDEFPPCDKNSTPCRDRDTNYIWSTRAHQDMVWNSAIAYCDNLSEGGYSDWSLPFIEVLKNFYDGDGHSKLGDTGCFWSFTSIRDSAYWIDFSDGSSCYSFSDDGKSIMNSVRCVR